MLSEVPHELSIPMRTPKSANGPRSNSFRPDSPPHDNLQPGTEDSASPLTTPDMVRSGRVLPTSVKSPVYCYGFGLRKFKDSFIVSALAFMYNENGLRPRKIDGVLTMNINLNPNSELTQFAVNAPKEFEVPDTLIGMAKQFQECMMQYTCAIREVKTKLEVLNDELSVRNSRNPIEMIKSRIKRPLSIVEKLQRRDLPVTVESMMQNLDDIAGIRVICSFIDDIYEISKMLARQDDVKVIAIKDYIRCPKENGYRSYHMIIEVPVYFSDSKKQIRVEVQIRTIAMDFWASLDHQLKYKKDLEDEDAAEIGHELRNCAEIIAETDWKMLEVRQRIEEKGIIVQR